MDVSVDLRKMRNQARRLRTGGRCGRRYSPGQRLPIEVCTLREGHGEPHDWPSLASVNARQRALYVGSSNLRLASVSWAEALRQPPGKAETADDPTAR